VKASPDLLPDCQNSRAFTLVELAVVLALVALGTCLLTGAAAHTAPNVRGIQCLSNLRRLMTGWQTYANDNQDNLIAMFHGGYVGAGSWAAGWLDWTSHSDNTNVDYLANPRYSLIAPYVNGATNPFRCPANQYLSPIQRAMRWTRRVRSYSAQIGMGPGNAELGPWDPIYRHVSKTSDLLIPSPKDTTVIVEEHPDSINDPAFFPPRQTPWVDPPATYHNGGCNFGFADGHSEPHRWRGSLTSARAREVHARDGDYLNNSLGAPVGDADVRWMSFHTQRVSTNSY
jgi:prepilin-type processing-associated H-X9-DG protein/prepilin-type N-terminal cleavage/methylation domain-containing protein